MRSLLAPALVGLLALALAAPAQEAKPPVPPVQEPVKKADPTPPAPPKPGADKPAGKPEPGGKTDKTDKTDKPNPADKAEQKPEVKTRESEESDAELPPGATAEDIRAVRGAKAMLETEKRLAELLKKMKIGGDATYVRFESIDSWPYEDGFKGMPDSIRKLDGKRVAMAGFMLPIDEIENIKSFYLVKSLWSCCYGIPPDVNGLLRISVKGEKGCAYQYDPILVVGTFHLKKVMDQDYCVCLYTLEDALVRVIELD